MNENDYPRIVRMYLWTIRSRAMCTLHDAAKVVLLALGGVCIILNALFPSSSLTLMTVGFLLIGIALLVHFAAGLANILYWRWVDKISKAAHQKLLNDVRAFIGMAAADPANQRTDKDGNITTVVEIAPFFEQYDGGA